jgi:hypothetical protein
MVFRKEPDMIKNEVEIPVSLERGAVNKPLFAYSYDEECYFGEFNSPQSAAEEAFTDESIDFVWIGEMVKPTTIQFICGMSILENIQENGSLECGESAGSWLDKIIASKEKIIELEKYIANWINANDPITFFTVKNVRKVSRDQNT